MFYYEEFEDRTNEHRTAVKKLASDRGIECESVPLSFGDAPRTWRTITTSLQLRSDFASSLIDISTMPRETLWIALSQLRRDAIETSYVYNSPVDYADWLSRDPGRPRLVYKLSGIASLGKQTCLIITTGYDPERTRQLMWFYEPRKILIGFQTGSQFSNSEKNIKRHRDSLREEYREFEVQEFEIDAYGTDRGEGVLVREIEKLRSTHNLVMTSLGPKLGALAHFQAHLKYPETSLAYTPAKEFNTDYSIGISQSHYGHIQW